MDRSRKLGKLSRGVSVLGVGMTKIGSVATTAEIKGLTERELWHWAAREAMEDANCRPQDIQAQYMGNAVAELFTHSYHLDGAVQRWCGLKRDGLGVAGCRVESACSAGGHALREGIFAIASGVYDVVLAGGVEIRSVDMNSTYPASVVGLDMAENYRRLARGCDIAFHYLQEPWPSTLFGGFMTAYAHEYSLKKDEVFAMLDGITISRHRSAARNPKASLNYELDTYAGKLGFANVKEFLHSEANPLVWWPLRASDLICQCDGASAVVLCATEMAKEFHPDPIEILGTGCAHGQLYNPTYSAPATLEAARQAYEMAGITAKDLDFIEIHVCNGGLEPSLVEDFGYCERGQYWKIARDGRTAFDGDKPVSPDGGQRALGNAIAANAGAQAYEIVNQIRGKAGSRQIRPTPEIALAQTLGATGDMTQVVLIYGRK